MRRSQALFRMAGILCLLFVCVFYWGISTAPMRGLDASTKSGLNEIYAYLTSYANDHNGKLPPMKSTAELEQSLTPYFDSYSSNSQLVFSDPRGEALQTNSLFGGQQLNTLPGSAVLMYDPETWRWGKQHLVLFASGRVAFVPERSLRHEVGPKLVTHTTQIDYFNLGRT